MRRGDTPTTRILHHCWLEDHTQYKGLIDPSTPMFRVRKNNNLEKLRPPDGATHLLAFSKCLCRADVDFPMFLHRRKVFEQRKWETRYWGYLLLEVILASWDGKIEIHQYMDL